MQVPAKVDLGIIARWESALVGSGYRERVTCEGGNGWSASRCFKSALQRLEGKVGRQSVDGDHACVATGAV